MHHPVLAAPIFFPGFALLADDLLLEASPTGLERDRIQSWMAEHAVRVLCAW